MTLDDIKQFITDNREKINVRKYIEYTGFTDLNYEVNYTFNLGTHQAILRFIATKPSFSFRIVELINKETFTIDCSDDEYAQDYIEELEQELAEYAKLIDTP